MLLPAARLEKAGGALRHNRQLCAALSCARGAGPEGTSHPDHDRPLCGDGSHFVKGTIAASIYPRPYVQGQTAVRLAVDHILRGRPIPETSYLNPAIVMKSNLHLFPESQSFHPSKR